MNKPRPYIDRGKPGTLRYQGGHLLEVKPPAAVPQVIVTLQAVRRHNTLEPCLQPTHRIFLRWSESAGSGLPDEDADQRESHYDPLPPDMQTKVEVILTESPWEALIRKRYRTNLNMTQLADALCISRTQIYADVRSALWYFTGRFQSARIYG